MAAPAYNDATFRQQFPQFANENSYPQASVSFAWTMASNWVSPNQAMYWGLGSENPENLQQAIDLMAAVVLLQLFGPSSGAQMTASQQGMAPGPLASATEGSVSTNFQLPEFGSSTFRSLCLSSPPYGTMLLTLLEISANVGPYIASGRPAWVPP